MDDAYERLARLKMKDESFSDVVRRLTGKKGSILDCVGLLADWPEENWKKMEKILADARKETNKRKIPQW